MRNNLSPAQSKIKRRQILKRQITEWGVGGSGFVGARLSIPTTTPAADAPAALAAPIAAPAALPIGNQPISPADAVKRLHELKTCLHEIEQAAIWLSHCLPTVFAFTKRKLATEKRELTKELTRLEKKLANQ